MILGKDGIDRLLAMPLETLRPTKPRTPENFRAPMRELAGLTSLLTQVQTTEQKGKSHDQ